MVKTSTLYVEIVGSIPTYELSILLKRLYQQLYSTTVCRWFEPNFGSKILNSSAGRAIVYERSLEF